MTITMHRGDTKQLKFRRLSGGEPITSQADQIYFTVKRAVNPLPKEPVLQKKLDDMVFDEEYYYHLTIEPEDTDELEFGDYDFDIQITADGVKHTTCGTLRITKEVTFAENEV